jgi:hypothetical protein
MWGGGREDDEPPPPEALTPEAVSNLGWFGQTDPQHDESRWGSNTGIDPHKREQQEKGGAKPKPKKGGLIKRLLN